MTPSNFNRTSTLMVLAVLLAATTTGSLTWCEMLLGIKPEAGPTVQVTVQAGNNVNNFTPLGSVLSRFVICDFATAPGSSSVNTGGVGGSTVPPGVYCRVVRNFGLKEPTATADLIASASAPPGIYALQYRDASPGSYIIGTLNLNVLPAEQPEVSACMAVYGAGEVIMVNQTTNFYGCCSQSPKDDPIVQYKWWWDYNGNPSSTPSATTPGCMTTHVYTTPGPRTTRLVVRTESGKEAADTYDIVVQGL